MKKIGLRNILMTIIIFSLGFSTIAKAGDYKKIKKQRISTELFTPIADSIDLYIKNLACIKGNVAIKDIYIYKNKNIDIHFSNTLSEYPLREKNIKDISNIVKIKIPKSFSNYKVHLYSHSKKLYQLRSHYYDGDKFPYKNKKKSSKDKWVYKEDRPYDIKYGLNKKQISIWNSHGYYYEPEMERWEWQRARILQTVEDKYTRSIMIPYLLPMLENAGAYTITPTERDPQTQEIIVDNKSNEWYPCFPKSDKYSVYIKYNRSNKKLKETRYVVKHKYGENSFIVNENKGDSLWVYLGTFFFDKGKNNQGLYKQNNGLSGIARFGGGIGESGRPRFQEGASDFLKYSGFKEEVYGSEGSESKYKNDYISRGLWVNSLLEKGIDIDLSVALHTDAGITAKDSIIGTLCIFSHLSDKKTSYPNKLDRLASRELADIIQTQIVDDIRATYEPQWTRRGLWDKRYSEARLPKVPTVLIELLSHQNFSDMRYGHDPNFKFLVSRSIYKGILKYQAYYENRDYVVQPLPIKNFQIQFSNKKANKNNAYVNLSWAATDDTLEASARAEKFMIVTKLIDTSGNYITCSQKDIITEKNSITLSQEKGKIYSYQIIALNDGGASFPSETLCAYFSPKQNSNKALIFNGFNRLSAPSSFRSGDSTLAGFTNYIDSGIAYHQDYSFTGPQYEYRLNREWENDDNPGFGASYGSYEAESVAGNTFDYTVNHGIALAQSNYSFVSASRSSYAPLENYDLVDIIMGKQISSLIGSPRNRNIKYKVFTPELQKNIKDLSAHGGKVIISGSYITTDAWDNIYDAIERDTIGISFIKNTLHIKHQTTKASFSGKVEIKDNEIFSFFMNPNPNKYSVESPCGFLPTDKNAIVIMKYQDTGLPAAVKYINPDSNAQIISLGFPIEALKSQEQINSIFKYILK